MTARINAPHNARYAPRPAAPRVMRAPQPASDKQIALVFKLNGEKVTNGLLPADADTLSDIRHGKDVSSRSASSLIDGLFAAPRKPREVPAAERPAPGYYVRAEDTGLEEHDGEPQDVFYVVVENKAKTGTYAKRLDVTTVNGRKRADWNYAPGVGRNIALEGLETLTIERAAAFGHLHGFCFKCCKPLTDPVSVQRGMGPVCAKALR